MFGLNSIIGNWWHYLPFCASMGLWLACTPTKPKVTRSTLIGSAPSALNDRSTTLANSRMWVCYPNGSIILTLHPSQMLLTLLLLGLRSSIQISKWPDQYKWMTWYVAYFNWKSFNLLVIWKFNVVFLKLIIIKSS